MAYQTFQEFNKTGLEGLFLYSADTVPIFIPMLLFTIFMVITFGSYFSQKRLSNKGNFFASFAVGGYVTTIIAFVMMLIPNLINTLTLTICVGVSIIGTVMLLVSRGD